MSGNQLADYCNWWPCYWEFRSGLSKSVMLVMWFGGGGQLPWALVAAGWFLRCAYMQIIKVWLKCLCPNPDRQKALEGQCVLFQYSPQNPSNAPQISCLLREPKFASLLVLRWILLAMLWIVSTTHLIPCWYFSSASVVRLSFPEHGFSFYSSFGSCWVNAAGEGLMMSGLLFFYPGLMLRYSADNKSLFQKCNTAVLSEKKHFKTQTVH